MILEKPFLDIGRYLIDMQLGELILRFKYEKVTFNVFEVMHHYNKNPPCYSVNIVEEVYPSESSLLPIEYM